jgi:dCTP deaminase
VIFSDRSIKTALSEGRLEIDPFEVANVQPSSVDLRVAATFRVFANHLYPYIDPRRHQENLTSVHEVGPDDHFILHPGEFALGATLERVRLGDDIVARLEGKSSLGRLGMMIHSTAGFVDPGFDGHLTLELSNVAQLPIAIYPGMRIGQISFYQMTTAADNPYGSGATGSRYQGQVGPTASRSHQDFR